MTTYVETADVSDLAPSWANTSLWDNDMVEGASGGGNFSVSVPGSSTRSGSFITVAAKPNNDDWSPDSTSQTVETDLMMGSVDVTGRCRIVRLSPTGTILQSGAFTGTQVMDISRTFSPVSPVWTAGACGDRIAIEFELVNSNGMNKTIQFNIRVTTAECIIDIPEDVAACVGAAAAVFPTIINSSAMMAFSMIVFYGQMLLSKVGVLAKPCPCRKKKIILQVKT